MPTPSTAQWPPPRSSDEWEDMVLDAMRLHWGDRDAVRVGRSGQGQRGVDVHGRDQRTREHLGAQAKNRRTINLRDIERELAKAERFRPKLARYYFVLSGSRDEKLQARVRAISDRREAGGRFGVHVLFVEDVRGHLAARPDLVRKYWPGWTPPGLRVVGVVADDARPPTTLDVKLRNVGGDVCFAKSVEIDVHAVGALYTFYRPSLQSVTGEYDVDLDPREPTPHVIEVPLAQKIRAGDTDRFVLRFRYPPSFDWFVHNVIVHATLRVVYNEDDARTDPVQLLFTVRPPYEVRAMRIEPPAVRAQKDAANRWIYAEMLGLPGAPSPTVERMRVEVPTVPAGSPTAEFPPHHRIVFGEADAREHTAQQIFRRPPERRAKRSRTE
jgi:hypothetical protein